MNLLPGTQQFAGNNPLAVGVSGQPVRVYSVELISGATASTVTLYNGTSAVVGNTYAQIDGTASKSTLINYAGGKRFPAGCYLGTDANTGYITVVYTMEF